MYGGLLNEDKDIESLNKTFIALIPKILNTKMMEQFRPISLCNVVYKIIAKVLANRIKKMLDTIISPSQSTLSRAG